MVQIQIIFLIRIIPNIQEKKNAEPEKLKSRIWSSNLCMPDLHYNKVKKKEKAIYKTA
jgi:hypothetical protein